MCPPQPPTEPGLFREEPFAHFLVRALDARVGGALAVEPPGGPSCVVQLKRGIPRRVRCADNFALFGGVLVNAGVVTSTEIERALCDPGLVGEALVALGHIDERTLEWALARQLILRMARIFGFPPATTFVFREGVDAFADTPGRAPRVDPLQILWVGLRTHAEASTRMHGTLGRIGRAPFTIRGDADVRRFGFSGEAVQLVEVIQRGRVTLPELVAARLAPEPLCRALVYTLSLSRYLDVAPVAEIVDEESTDDAVEP
ncbi:MAG: hypothetical protein IT373_29630, partial [Polyangiaceae bacterium]|nr:hypothetical protein [Polyangiaceae bacterium]